MTAAPVDLALPAALPTSFSAADHRRHLCRIPRPRRPAPRWLAGVTEKSNRTPTKDHQIIVGWYSIASPCSWDSTLATRSLDPTLTRMEGLPGLPVLRLAMTGGSLFMDGLTIAFGEATSALSAGGVNANLSGDAILTLTRCVISENHSSFGTAGVRIRAAGTSQAQLCCCTVTGDNTAERYGRQHRNRNAPGPVRVRARLSDKRRFHQQPRWRAVDRHLRRGARRRRERQFRDPIDQSQGEKPCPASTPGHWRRDRDCHARERLLWRRSSASARQHDFRHGARQSVWGQEPMEHLQGGCLSDTGLQQLDRRFKRRWFVR